MSRSSLLLFTLLVSVAARGADRFIPVFTGNVSNRTFRTTVDLRSATTEECRFELRAPNGAMFHSVVSIEAGKPQLLDEFAAEFKTFATTVMVSCTGAVDVHSRIHESRDGGATYTEGSLFRAVVPEPLSLDHSRTIPITADIIIAEIQGAPVRVAGTLTAPAKWTADKQWDLPAFGEHAILLTDLVRSEGPMEANLRAVGEGQAIILSAVTDPAFANVGRRAPDAVRAQLDAQVRAAAAPPSASAPPITRQLVSSSFKAAPFQEPMTGLVFMRDRWYDPKTGSFMTPDPEGYRDSSNLYSFCGGDPVNCSDPTGRAASVNMKGDIIGIRPGGSRYFISASEAQADPVSALRLLESDNDLDFGEQEEIMRMAGLPIPISSACRPGENCLSGGKSFNPNAFTHRPQHGMRGCVEGVFIEAAGLPPISREGALCGGGARIVGTTATAFGTVKGGNRARNSNRLSDNAQPHEIRAGGGTTPEFDTHFGPYRPESLPDGLKSLERVQDYSGLWPRASLREAVQNVAGGPSAILEVTPTGKAIFRNPTTGNQVIYDRVGNYFRIRLANGEYVGSNYVPIPSNVLLLKPNKNTQTGTPADVRDSLTHFRNND